MAEGKLRLEDLLDSSMSASVDEGRINNVAIIGAGIMGQGIAQTVAGMGLEVTVLEINNEKLETAKAQLTESIDREIKRWAMTKSDKKSIFSRIRWETDNNTIKDCEIIIEAVQEDFDLKVKVFQELDKIINPDAIFVSNTSTLSLTKISESISRSTNVIGMHFLNPVPKIPMVELVKSLHTSNETVSKAKEFAARIGKTPVEVYEYPGFITTRAIVPLINEAMHMLLEGIATAKDIDTALKLGYNFQYGPLEMADAMGLDEVLTWMETLWKTLGEPRYRPNPMIRKFVRERRLGKKTGEGIFKYDEHGNKIN
ncbi:MAG TPA: 3-hydroxyacyl-CoA dehydrogenase NAD-binding domain-containing protein [Ignavibacteriaceae bacterium]|jgi:3-hydroxybutyryl-CoA dehydrogenase|nr:MAG: putative 3-hydroxybutyryl-CoA dehydrogenase [Ignavibacteria bacterium ADurb.Bin266]OQY72201.1 MAG: 3-hydroxybutyryl-CoA dehydrogenase [Ignavibacteriales bacterium UTCHB2]HQF42062.1 3-hydroxyacyl-CoA dehydrogenase NAD-binding domain-containing protein [Ignavibacteriaceae bacterium]HQI40869.1 3-hydroxyacyl-CoA dehydrogenase NAD-binding domain-containing protein [Ignavibacteriaceae bacterium]